MTAQTSETISVTLAAKDYVQLRTQAGWRDINYLQLTDLYRLLVRMAPSFRGDVFDYGCGGAPYRALFKNCRQYVAADVTPGPAVNKLLGADGLTGEPEAHYDGVLSTQVLEHVPDAVRYLRECHRILRPGGKLLVTTHGFVEEHGCPYDFRRWTNRGLEVDVTSAGFRVEESGKLTTEVRAVCQLAHQLMLHLRCDGRPLVHYPLAVVRRLYFLLAMPVLNCFARGFEHQGLASATSDLTLYTGVFVLATKPPLSTEQSTGV